MVLGGIIHVKRNGLRWRDAPPVHGPHRTLRDRFVRWSRLGVFARMLRDLACRGAEGDTIMIVQHPLKAHRTAASLSKGGLRPRATGRTKGGPNSKLHMVSDGRGRPLSFFLSPGQMSDARGALVLLAGLPKAKRILGDKGHHADWLRDELKARGLRTCIPARRGRRRPASRNKRLCNKRHRIGNAFSRLKDRRGTATRYTRCGDPFLPAICLAATVLFWLPK